MRHRAEQVDHQIAHAADLVSKRQGTHPPKEQSLLHIAPQGRGQLLVDAELSPGGQANAQAALRQAVKRHGAAWLDVGHGLQAGLVMLQAQSALAALILSAPDAEPKHLLTTANRVIFDD